MSVNPNEFGLTAAVLPRQVRQGEGKTLNVPPGQLQREDWTNRQDTKFGIDVRMVTCVHGTWSKVDDTPTTFVVLQCEFNSKHEDYFIKKIKIELKFLDDTESDGPPAKPTIVGRGPHILRRWNPGEEDVEDETGAEGNLETPVVKQGLKLNWKRNKKVKREYFEEARSGLQHESNTDHRYTRVWWVYRQNQQKRDGLAPGLRVAVLVKRENASPFQATFKLSEMDAGWRYQSALLWSEFWGKHEPNVDDPINFDPAREPLGGTGIDASSLGDLVTDTGISKEHAWIWGVDLGT